MTGKRVTFAIMLRVRFDISEDASRETTLNFDVGRDRCGMKLF